MLESIKPARALACSAVLLLAGCNFKDTEALAPPLTAKTPAVVVADSLQTANITLPYQNTGAIAVRCEVEMEDNTIEATSCACVSGVCTVGLQRTLASSATVNFDFTLWDAVGQSSSAEGSFISYGTTPTELVMRTSAPSESITLPLYTGYTYHFQVDWGDGSPVALITSHDDADATHVFAVAGDYTITLDGLVQALVFNGTAEATKLISVPELGNVGWTSLVSTFMGCTNLTVVAGGDTSQVTIMVNTFRDATIATPDTSTWDTSNVTSMYGMFFNATNANPDVTSWDTSKVTNFTAMFRNTGAAMPDTSHWDTSSATDFNQMFYQAAVANPDTSGWDTSNVTTMNYMFYQAPAANPVTTNWDTSKVTIMNHMFRGATSANPDVSNWDTGEVTAMYAMFNGATSANPDVSGWDVSKVTTMYDMFRDATSANPDVSNWNTASLTTTTNMFMNATSANPDISGWNVSGITVMANMFRGTALTNPDFSNWQLSQVTNMSGFLFGTTISTASYSDLLIRLAAQNTNTTVGLNAGSAEYNAGAVAARATLVGRGWTISDGGLE